MDFHEIKRVGMAAACRGAEVLCAHFGRLSRIGKKGRIDLVTEADTGSERVVIETIRNAFPDHAILAEESGMRRGSPDHRWIIDPLDGTTNYANGLDLFCVSIAYAHRSDICVGVILSPMTGELFTAIRGEGAFRNGRPIRVSTTDRVSDSLLVTGFPYEFGDGFKTLLDRFGVCVQASQGVRRLGSAALDLCYVACGRFAGYWEENLHPWDTAAGTRIAKEAGAIVTDFSNTDYSIDKNEILATNGGIHREMLTLLSLEDRG